MRQVHPPQDNTTRVIFHGMAQGAYTCYNSHPATSQHQQPRDTKRLYFPSLLCLPNLIAMLIP